ncbi:MAG: site-specific integrase [Treponema sp.]|nr:site-specific integrase [Treponema sp.]
MNAYPFSVYKRADRPYYLVQFNDENGKQLPAISTKQKTEEEAVRKAFQWLRDGIPQKQNTVRVHNLSLRETVKNLKDPDDAETMIAELQRQGWLKSFVMAGTQQAQDFIGYLATFWDWDKSPYIQEKLRKAHGIHRRHCSIQGGAISLYWEPFFNGRFLGDITAADIDAFITHMGEKDLSASRKNVVIKAGTKPLRWAFSKGHIDKDPTRGHTMFAGEERKRSILTPTVAAAVFRTVWEDDRVKLANMLSAVTGMRNGEILALQFKNLGADCIYVDGSWNKEDGRKPPKNNKTRTVEIPFPDLMYALIEMGNQNPWSKTPERFIFWSTTRKKVPMQGQHFGRGLREALIKIGFSKEEAAKYDFHSWRHFYTSYMIRKLDKKLLKSQTGHLTDVMLAHYADHETVGDRELIHSAQKETFAGLLPETPKLVTYKKMGNKIACSA